MDQVPIVPENETTHCVLSTISEAVQDKVALINEFPQNIAENVTKYKIETIPNARKCTFDFQKYNAEEKNASEKITEVEEEMMRIQAKFLESYAQWKDDVPYNEAIRLKRYAVFEDLQREAIEMFSLLSRNDLLPNKIEQYLNFCINTELHTCELPCPSEDFEDDVDYESLIYANKKLEEQRTSQDVHRKDRFKRPPMVFSPDPHLISFDNYQLNTTYKKKLKLRNISHHMQPFGIVDFPHTAPFRAVMQTPSNRLAPGMFAEFMIIFKTKIFKNEQYCLTFKALNGSKLCVVVRNTRDPPRLCCYLHNILTHFVQKPLPGISHFSIKRQCALNLTIDCGSCLSNSHNVVSLFMTNEGSAGKFFITNEEEWIFSQLELTNCRMIEVKADCFSIFPTYFEIDEGEMVEMFVVFLPKRQGLFSEKLYMVCDNNSRQEIELVGECVSFSKSYITVEVFLSENSHSTENNCVNITCKPFLPTTLLLTVRNKSSLYLFHYWSVQNKNCEGDGKIPMNPGWITIRNHTKCLPLHSESDFLIDIMPATEVEGFYSGFLSLYIRDVPLDNIINEDLDSSPTTQDYITCSCDGRTISSETSEMSSSRNFAFNDAIVCADIHICEIEFCCFVKISPRFFCECKSVDNEKAPPDKIEKLRFLKTSINFGLLHENIKLTSSFTIENLYNGKIKWKVVEILFKNETANSKATESKVLKCWTGKFAHNGQRRKLKYTLHTKEPTRWISILVLMSASGSSDTYSIENTCLVIYEVCRNNVKIYTDTNNFPVLCPKELLYVGIPSLHHIYIHNKGPLMACYYFMKSDSKDLRKIHIELEHQSDILPPGKCLTVACQLTPLEPGIIEDIFLPCFTGDIKQIPCLRVMCSVDLISVQFYLPNRRCGYNKYLWPPKSEHHDWDIISGFGEDGMEGEGRIYQEYAPAEDQDSVLYAFPEDSVAATYPTVEIRDVQIRTPIVVKFYIENITPIIGKFAVEALNFGMEHDRTTYVMVTSKLIPREVVWKNVCMNNGYGIVIESQNDYGKIVGYEVVEVTLYIYASTWGIYLEEMCVEIDDLTPFCFNLVIEAVGTPFEFLFARNTIQKEPIFSFAPAPYKSSSVTRSLSVANTSAVPIYITWHMFDSRNEIMEKKLDFNVILEILDEDSLNDGFMNVIFTRDYFGDELQDGSALVTPTEIFLEKDATAMLSLTLNFEDISVKSTGTDLRYTMIGYIHLRDEHKFKESYYIRKSAEAIKPVKLNILATLEAPCLELDLINIDDIKIDVFANDIIFNLVENKEICLMFRNHNYATFSCCVDIEPPFELTSIQTNEIAITTNDVFEVKEGHYVKIKLAWDFSYKDILDFAQFIYENEDDNITSSYDYVASVSKCLRIQKNGLPEQAQVIPLHIDLHFPEIEIKPDSIKFGHVLLFNTKQQLVSIYNLHGSIVKFETYKSTTNTEFVVNPCYGEIARSTGMNNQFVDFFVYFTPKECKSYEEVLRIYTNLPQYYVDIPVSGHGSNNEKFYVG